MCYCGRPLEFSACCKQKHLDHKLCESAEDLMRSRYSAYVLGNIDYIIETTIKNKRNEIDKDVINEWSEKSEWLELRVLNTSKSHVDFIAYYKQEGNFFRHYEKSTFVKDGDYWFYDSGEIIVSDKYSILQTSRNASCSCGSNLKFKKCCAKYL